MIKKLILIFLFLYFYNLPACFALEWKKCHEDADKSTLTDALTIVTKSNCSPESLYTLALVYLNLRKYSDADKTFDDILAIDPKTAEAQWGKAEILRRRHNLDKSESVFNQLIKSNPDFSPAWISLATIKYTRQQFNNSILLAYHVIKQGRKKVDLNNYVRAILLAANNKGMIAHYGGPLSKLINGTAIHANLKRAEKLRPGSPDVSFSLGSFYLLAPSIIGRDIKKAQAYLEKTITADPLFADAYVRLAQVYQLKNDNIKYAEYIKKALEVDPGSALALDIKNGACQFICMNAND